jgi:Helix-turn-helix domain
MSRRRLIRRPSYRRCSLPGCQRKHCAKDLCWLHYSRKYHTGTTEPPAPKQRRPRSPSLTEAQRQKVIEAYIGGASIRTIATDIGTSTGPVQRLISEAGIARRRGQHSGPRHPLWKGGISGYKGAHRRLRRLRGSAVGQPCVDCGMPATNWSFRGRTGYSKDVTDYDQRCDTCHAIFDGKAKLNPKLAREIRELWATGEWTIKELADEFGVCTKTVRKVLTGQSWKTAGGPLHQTGATVNRKLTEEKVRIIRRRAAARNCSGSSQPTTPVGLASPSVRGNSKPRAQPHGAGDRLDHATKRIASTTERPISPAPMSIRRIGWRSGGGRPCVL